MRETITMNRIIRCTLIEAEVAQQVSAYSLSEHENNDAGEILTKYCSGYPACNSVDCQLVTGMSGKVYTKSLASICAYFNK
jgi:hypothetical protein